MITIIESGSNAWAIAATNGDLHVYGREEAGGWNELSLNEDSELDQDAGLILEALYEQHIGDKPDEDTDEPEADEEEQEPEEEEPEDLQEPDADEEEEELENEEEPEEEEPEDVQEPEAEEEEEEPEEEERKPRRRRARPTASRGKSKARAK